MDRCSERREELGIAVGNSFPPGPEQLYYITCVCTCTSTVQYMYGPCCFHPSCLRRYPLIADEECAAARYHGVNIAGGLQMG